MRKSYKNPNSNARFVAAGFCAAKFRKRGVEFYPYGAEPEARDAKLRGFKFCNEMLRHTQQIWQSRHPHFKFLGAKFDGEKFTTCGTEFLGANFRSAEFCKSKFRACSIKFYKAELHETGFLARTAKFYAAKFHGVKFQEIKFQAPNLKLKMKFNAAKFGGVKFRDGALLKFAAVKGLRRDPSLCTAAPFKFTAPQNAGFFATKFGKTEFCGVKFHKVRLRRTKFYAAEFAADGAKFCGAKRRGAGA